MPEQREYKVQWVCDFRAESPEDAVRQAMHYLESTPPSHWQYEVLTEGGPVVIEGRDL